MADPTAPVRRQLDAYNARDLKRFLAQYADDVQAFRLPNPQPAYDGKKAFGDFFAYHRFNLPDLHAEVVNRMVLGNKVIDHERIIGIRAEPYETVAVYEVVGGLIRKVWFFSGE
jgi:hypothetical protein